MWRNGYDLYDPKIMEQVKKSNLPPLVDETKTNMIVTIVVDNFSVNIH